MATKIFNSSLDIKGNLIIAQPFNSVGTILTFGSGGIVSTRTNAEIISDLGLATQSWVTSQGYITNAAGLNYPISDNGEESFMQTDGSGNLTFQYVKTIYEQIYNGETTTILKGDPLYISGSQGANSIAFKADAANPAKMPVTYISADNIAPGATGRGIVLGLIKGVDTTGYPAGTEVYVAPGGGWTKTRPTGSNIVQLLGIVTKEGIEGQVNVLNPGPATLPNLSPGNVWVGNLNGLPVATPTSSLGGTPVYTHTQSVATDSWEIAHNLGTSLPIVTVYDSSMNVIIPQEVKSISTSSLSITFPLSISGYASIAGGPFSTLSPGVTSDQSIINSIIFG